MNVPLSLIILIAYLSACMLAAAILIADLQRRVARLEERSK